MRAGRNSRGYTIVETMIFLAISGMMFVMAASFVSGRQSKAEFRQGMNDMNSQIQTVINDVSNGFFPSQNNFKCSADSSGSQPVISGGSVSQGANGGDVAGVEGCVFLGKAIQFGLKDAHNNPVGYNIYSVAGRQYATTESVGTLPTTFAQSKPKVVDQLTVKKTTEWGLQITKMVDNSTHANINGIAFFTSLGKYDTATGSTLQSGNQSLLATPIAGTALIPTELDTDLIPIIEHYNYDTLAQSNTNVVICFDNGGNASEFGSITIGGGTGQRLTVVTKIGDTAAKVNC